MVSESGKNTDDAALQASYEEYMKAQKPQQEVRARHILLKKTEDEAKKTLERIKGGEISPRCDGSLD